MTARNDRRHTVQRYTVPEVQAAIVATVYGDENKRIMRDLFLNNATYQMAADAAHLSLRGLHKRVRTIYPPMVDYLQKHKVH